MDYKVINIIQFFDELEKIILLHLLKYFSNTKSHSSMYTVQSSEFYVTTSFLFSKTHIYKPEIELFTGDRIRSLIQIQ